MSWTFILGGDIMLNGIAPGSKPLDALAPHFRQADVAFANLEIPLTKATARTRRKTPAEIARRSQFVLKADPRHIMELKARGLSLVSLGNNHAMDYGPVGLREMLSLLDGAGIRYAGAGLSEGQARALALLRVPRPPAPSLGGGQGGGETRPVRMKRLVVGMLSYLAFQTRGGRSAAWPARGGAPGVAVLDFGGAIDDAARSAVRKAVSVATKSCDFLVISLHWGIERQSVPTSYQVAMARAFVDSGADLVVGHHPHVLQGAEVYRRKPILYSLGNLVSPLGGDTGLVRLRLEGSSLTALDFLPCRISGGRVKPLEGAGARRVSARFAGLCRKLRSRYPHRESRVPAVGAA